MQGESKQFGPITATTALFSLIGGQYEFEATATWGGGTVKVEKLTTDGSTYLSVGGPDLTANGGWTGYLPPGAYRVNVATATAVYASLTRIQDN